VTTDICTSGRNFANGILPEVVGRFGEGLPCFLSNTGFMVHGAT